MELCVFSQRLQKLSAEGTAELVAYDYRAQKKTALPKQVRKNIEALEGRML
jgi:acyl-CoA thioesterase FadM